jgi:hypothetical protein
MSNFASLSASALAPLAASRDDVSLFATAADFSAHLSLLSACGSVLESGSDVTGFAALTGFNSLFDASFAAHQTTSAGSSPRTSTGTSPREWRLATLWATELTAQRSSTSTERSGSPSPTEAPCTGSATAPTTGSSTPAPVSHSLFAPMSSSIWAQASPVSADAIAWAPAVTKVATASPALTATRVDEQADAPTTTIDMLTASLAAKTTLRVQSAPFVPAFVAPAAAAAAKPKPKVKAVKPVTTWKSSVFTPMPTIKLPAAAKA